MPKQLTIDGYSALLKRVRETLVEGQARIEAERVRIYWEAGRHIHVYILKLADRAERGAEVFKRLENDLKIDLSVLQRCVQFYKTYPKFPYSAGQRNFNWSHYMKLITIPDKKERVLLERRVIDKGWSAEELALRLKEHQPTKKQIESELKPIKETLLTPLRGIPYTYQIIKRPDVSSPEEPEFYLDLGFGNFQELAASDLKFTDKQIVESRPREDKYKLFESKRTPKDLYTYRAVVERIIDGDTLKVRFNLGFGQWHRETLRLRGLDAAEMDTKEGQAAKAFVQSYIKEAQMLIVRSSRSDKYDRYLADVFIASEKEPDEATDLYLNNLLLERGHAKRMVD